MQRGVFDVSIADDRPGCVTLEVSGEGAEAAFAGESGGHRWQRIPPNEKRGRVHTSTVTVAVMAEPKTEILKIPDKEIEWTTTKGSGPGGQHRNKTESAVVAKHLPTGLTVRCESERSQSQNKRSALAILRAKVWEAMAEETKRSLDASRKSQVGSGMRGDKIRTIRCQDGVVIDHLTSRKWRLKEYLRGEW